MDPNRNAEDLQVSWRALVFGPLATVLFFAALWLNDGGTAIYASGSGSSTLMFLLHGGGAGKRREYL